MFDHKRPKNKKQVSIWDVPFNVPFKTKDGKLAILIERSNAHHGTCLLKFIEDGTTEHFYNRVDVYLNNFNEGEELLFIPFLN